MKQMKMSVKIYAVMAILVVVAIVVAVVGVTYLSSLNQNLNNIVNGSAEKVKLGARLQQDLLAIHRAEKNIILANNQERMDEYAANIETQRKEMQDRRETLRELVDDQGKRDLDEFAQTWDEFLKANAEVRRLARLNSNNKAADLSSGKGREAYEACAQIMKAIADANDKAVSQTSERTDLDPAAKTAEMDKAASRALLSARVIQDMLEIHRAEKNVILSKTQEEMDEYAAATDTLLADMKGRLGELNKLATEEGKAQLLEFQKAWDNFVALNRQVRDTSRENGNARAFALSTGKGRELADKAEEQLRAIVERNEQEMATDAKASDEAATTAKYTMILLSAIGILLASVVAYLVLNGINKRLLQVVQGLAEGAEQTASASGQISSASQQLAEGATEQAASLEETSSALEEIASQTRQNADNANQADTSMKDTRGQVEKGGQAVQNMTSAMQEISESSDETSKIIKTIEEIAFQTNLLALNAAVEAARAGDAGKGFAVVADEVRNLAQRSAQAARDTSELIEGTVSRVKNGAQLVEELQVSFKEIEESSSKVANLVNDITSASDEQAQGVDQVNTAVAQMDKVTQTNAANAEESASASEELNAQADQLNTMVGTLTEIVQGRNGNGHISRSLTAPSRSVQSRGPARQLSSSSHGEGNSGEKNLPAKQREEPKVVKPNDVIPLEDDEDFSEF